MKIDWRITSPKISRKAEIIALVLFVGFLYLFNYQAMSTYSSTLQAFRVNLNGDVQDITVNGKSLRDYNQFVFISEIRRFDSSPDRYHHSHPGTCFNVAVQKKNSIVKFALARDSVTPHKYWLFSESCTSANNIDIGMINTTGLDGYSSRFSME